MPSFSSPHSRQNERSVSSPSSIQPPPRRPVSRPQTNVRSVNVIDNLDEILTQRSQVSMSQYNGSGDESGHSSYIRRRHSSRLDRSVTPPTSRNRQSPEQVALVANKRKQVDNFTIQRRHSSAAVRRGVSSSSSESSYDGVLTNRRPTSRRSMATTVAPIHASIHDDDSENGEESNGGFLSCMRCFKTSSAPQPPQRSVIMTSPKLPMIFQNRYCQFAHKYLMLMSENLEADVLGTSSSTDSRLVFILYSLLSGEALLTPDEYDESDEWCDWLSLGFSDSTLDAFDRDINRNGSQTMGLLFQLFFASQYPQISKMCVIIVRNVHFIPSPLFGLFSVNCAKWTRDVIIATLHRYDQKGPDRRIPPLIESAKSVFNTYNNFSNLFDWWVSNGHSGSIDRLESSLLEESDAAHVSLPRPSAATGMYESFADDDDEEESEHIPLAYKSMPVAATASGSPNRRVSFQPASRIPGIDLMRRTGGDNMELIKSIFVVGGLYYTYCILLFTKFWLEQKLIEVDSETARERLNNQFLETSFVSKLELSSSMTVSDVEKRIEKLIQRIENLWESSGWTKENLLAN